jgi:cell division protein FtsZ
MINVDFNDVNTVMRDSGVAIMGSAVAEGDNRAIEAVQDALSSPLLNDNNIEGAKYVLLNITYGTKEILMDEIGEITDYIQDEAGATADVIWGHGQDETLGEGISVTIIATGFNSSPITGFEKEPEKKVVSLDENVPTMISRPIETPTQKNEWVDEKKEVINEVEEDAEPFLKEQPEAEEQAEINWSFASEAAPEEDKKETPVNEEQEEKEVVRHFLTDDLEEKVEMTDHSEVQSESVLSLEEQQERARERMERIQVYTAKLKSSTGISDLEKEPAYKRKNIQIEDVPHSSEESMSKFTLSDDHDGEKGGLRDNNSFLHDNVD